jgi:hypothetical protein
MICAWIDGMPSGLEEGALETTTFKGVWFRSRPVGNREVTMKAMEARGTLAISPGKLVFHSPKTNLDITGISDVSAQRHGRDIINRWITVTYEDGRSAMFVDGRLLGWSGLLGGNKRLLEAIEQAAAG